MGKVNQEMLEVFTDMLDNPSVDLESRVAKVTQLEDDSDQMMHDITDYLVRCSTNELSDDHANNITGILRIVSEFEEISDCEYRLVKLMERKVEKQHDINPDVIKDLREHALAVSEFITFYTQRLFQPISAVDIKQANRLEDKIDELRQTFNKAAMNRMQGEGNIKVEMLNIDISNQFEKIGNHALNVMETAHDMAD
jgi:phosphate:Na+ symporter